MTFGSSGTGTGIDNSIPEVREQEGNSKNPFPQFGNGKGMKKNIPKIREWEGNEKKTFPKYGNGKGIKNLFPKFRNGKRMKRIHSHNSGTGIRGYHSQECQGTGTGMVKNIV